MEKFGINLFFFKGKIRMRWFQSGRIIRFEWVLCFLERIFERPTHCVFVVLVLVRMENVAEPSVEGWKW